MNPVLEKWRKVCEAATSGKWVVESHADIKAVHGTFEMDDGELVPHMDWIIGYLQVSNCPNFRNDAEFIALSRTALPVAISALERAIEALQIILDPSDQSDFIQSLSAKDIAFEALEQIHDRLEQVK